MAISVRTLTDAEYVALRFCLIKQFEGRSATPYYPNQADRLANNLTIGYGFNLNGSQFIRNAVLGAIYPNSNDPTRQRLAGEMRTPAGLRRLEGDARLTMTDAQMRTAFDTLMDAQSNHAYEQIVNNWLQLQVAIPRSYERAVLVSLAYNGGERLLGQRLCAALTRARAATDVEGMAQDRAEAWYEIRYNSGNQYRRRIIESEVFGLYENAAAVTAEDARRHPGQRVLCEGAGGGIEAG